MTKNKRKLKIYEMNGYGYRSVPAIMLKGEWLKTLGFNAGYKIVVECSDDAL